MVLPQRRKSMLSQEEKKARLKETRQKYSQIGRAAASKIAPRPLTVPLQRAPTAPRASIAPIAPKRPIEKNDDDFEVDPKSLAMIKNCKVTMPVSRPSISSRNTLGARQSCIGRFPARSRVSMAPEPRTSLLPLGINVFDASLTQRNEISQYMNSLVESTKTPGKTSTSVACTSASSSTSNVFGSLLNSTRHRKIRFMDSTIQEVRESVESAEVAEVTAAAVHHSPIADTSFMPTSILSTRKKEKKKVTLDAPAPRTPRKLNFDDEDSAENSKISENITNEKNEKEVGELEKTVENLCTVKLSESETKRVKDAIEKLKKSLEESQRENMYRTPLKRAFPIAPVPMTPLGAIMESLAMNEDDEEEEEEEMDEEEKAFLERKKTRRRSSKMKVGSGARRSINRRVSRGSLKKE